MCIIEQLSLKANGKLNNRKLDALLAVLVFDVEVAKEHPADLCCGKANKQARLSWSSTLGVMERPGWQSSVRNVPKRACPWKSISNNSGGGPDSLFPHQMKMKLHKFRKPAKQAKIMWIIGSLWRVRVKNGKKCPNHWAIFSTVAWCVGEIYNPEVVRYLWCLAST